VIFKTRLRRVYERRLRDQGNPKSWSIKQASLATIREMLDALPLHLRLKVLLASGFGLTLEKTRRMLGMRSGT